MAFSFPLFLPRQGTAPLLSPLYLPVYLKSLPVKLVPTKLVIFACQ